MYLLPLFYQFNASLLNKSIISLKKSLLTPNGSAYMRNVASFVSSFSEANSFFKVAELSFTLALTLKNKKANLQKAQTVNW